MDLGYDLRRVRALGQRTVASIDALGAIGSNDPAAAEAMRAIRLTRRNLEDLWMPAIRDIERSNAMIDWVARRPAGLVLPVPGPPPERGPRIERPLAALSDAELLGLVELIDRLLGNAPHDGPDTDGLGSLPAKYDPDVLAVELALRVERDSSFARALLALASDTVVVGQLIDRAPFPVPFVVVMARALAGPVSGRASTALDHHAIAMSAVLRALTADPSACLDLLADDAVLLRLATWDDLDPDALADFTLAALFDGVADRTHLADGFEVLARLTDLVAGPPERGLAPGMARGLALAMPAYLPRLAAGVFQTGDGPVRVSEFGLTIGTHDEVAALFGSLMHDDDAAGALGLALGAYTDARLRDGGPDLTRPGALDDVVHLSLLLDHAARSEQAQLVMEAAAEEARRRQLGDLLGIGAGVALTATGAGAAWRSAAALAIRSVTDALADVEPERLAGASITAHQYQRIWMSAMAVALDRAGPGGGTLELRRRLDEVEACDDPAERSVLIVDLRNAVEGTEVAEFVDEVMNTDGLSALR